MSKITFAVIGQFIIATGNVAVAVRISTAFAATAASRSRRFDLKTGLERKASPIAVSNH
jgi:hypothetical protein